MHDDPAGLVLLLHELLGERAERQRIVEAAQERQLGRDELDLGAVLTKVTRPSPSGYESRRLTR
ncbi:hypothetical protein [Streptomyces sp. MB09-01]|uniref:hypothetical protein n=1 Tax=Streptomyces sp. MB09-01 TaxID=3028666 RepID=UPI003A5C294A